MTEDRDDFDVPFPVYVAWGLAVAGTLAIISLVLIAYIAPKKAPAPKRNVDFDYAHRVSNLMNHWMLAEMSLVKLLKDENCGRETPPRAYPDLGSREQPSAPALDAQGNPIDLEPDGPDRGTPGDGSGGGRIQPRI